MKQPLNTRILTRAATVLTCAVCAVGLMTGCSQGSKTDSAASASATIFAIREGGHTVGSGRVIKILK